MAAKSDTKNFYKKPEIIHEPKHHYIMWKGPRFYSNRNVLYPVHGVEFKDGVVYRVSPLVFEWAKRQRGFHEIVGFETHKLLDFVSEEKK